MDTNSIKKKVLNKVKEFLSPDEKHETQHPQQSNTSGKLTNERIGNELVKQLKMEIPERSMWENMLFPMSFSVLMCESDYRQNVAGFGIIVKLVVKRFYEVLQNTLDDSSNKYTVCVPPSNNWYFQLAQCDFIEEPENSQNGVIDENEKARLKQIPVGTVVIVADLFALNISNISKENGLSQTMSMRIVNSNLSDKFDINKDLISSVNMISEPIISVPFDPSQLKGYEVDKRQANQASGLAELTWGGLKYTMLDNTVDISGEGDTRKQRNVLVIEGHKLQNQHIQIKHLGNGKFQIAAFQSPVLLNECAMPISKAGDEKWEDLPNNSKIFINGTLQLTFKNNQL